jgi:hypothetical protein
VREEMVEFMLRISRDEGAATKARIEAYTWLADRGFGRPTQIEVRFSGDDVVTPHELATELSRDELNLMIEEVQARIRAKGRRPCG